MVEKNLTDMSLKSFIKIMKKVKFAPFQVIGYLSDACKYYKEECVRKEDWKYADEMYHDLMHAYHVYCGVKKDYRKKK